MQLTGTAPRVLDARAATSTYVVFGLIVAVPCLLSPIAMSIDSMSRDKSHWVHDSVVIIFFSAVILLTFLWIRKFRILVEDSVLSYTSLFGGTRTLNLVDIEVARTEHGPQALLGPFFRLVVQPTAFANKPPIIINMKIFSRRDLEELFVILGDKVKGEPHYSMLRKKKDDDYAFGKE
jgi:hypothetical protein